MANNGANGYCSGNELADVADEHDGVTAAGEAEGDQVQVCLY